MEEVMEFGCGYSLPPEAHKYINERLKTILKYYDQLSNAEVSQHTPPEYNTEDIIAQAAVLESDEQMMEWLGRRRD